MTGFIEEIGKYIIGGIVGGLFAGVGAYITFSNRIARITEKVNLMEKNCDGCKTNTIKTLDLIVRDLNNHRADDEKHNNPASHQMLTDILSRVMRIETRLFKQDF